MNMKVVSQKLYFRHIDRPGSVPGELKGIRSGVKWPDHPEMAKGLDQSSRGGNGEGGGGGCRSSLYPSLSFVE